MAASHWTDSFLDAMRRVTDPPADDVIAAVVDSDETGAVNRMMRSLVENDDMVPDDLPPLVRDYLGRSGSLPDWAELSLIEKGQRAFLLHAPEVVLLLFYSSLPNAYAAKKGAQVLHMTRRLIGSYAWRRIIETAQFLVDVMTPGGLGPDGHGIRSAQKVRLMHAAIRHYLLHDPKWRAQWNPDWGMPINQEDLAGTLMTFSTTVMDGMHRFGVRMYPDEEEAFLHLWKVVGHLIGLHPDLLPVDVADGRDLIHTIFRRQWTESEAGHELTHTLLDMMQVRTPRLVQGLPRTALRYFAGKRAAQLLDVGRSDWTIMLLRAQRGIFALADRIDHESIGIGAVARWLNTKILEGVLSAERGGNRPPFRIPEGLRTTGLRVRPPHSFPR